MTWPAVVAGTYCQNASLFLSLTSRVLSSTAVIVSTLPNIQPTYEAVSGLRMRSQL